MYYGVNVAAEAGSEKPLHNVHRVNLAIVTLNAKSCKSCFPPQCERKAPNGRSIYRDRKEHRLPCKLEFGEMFANKFPSPPIR
jgi:hypothetical protein